MIRQLTAFLLAVSAAVFSVELSEALGVQGIGAYGIFLACLLVFGMAAVVISVGGVGPPQPPVGRREGRRGRDSRRGP